MLKNYNFIKGLTTLLLLLSVTFLSAQSGIVTTPVDGCDGADGGLALSDPGGVNYDVDIYTWDPVGMVAVKGPNMYSSNATPTISVTNNTMTCDAVTSTPVDLYYVPWQATFNSPADGTLISTNHSVTLAPTLTETVVAPDCAGTAPSVTITAPDGTVCFTMTGTAGEDPATACPTEPADGALDYSYTAFAGTSCEQVFAQTLGEICSCACPSDLGTYTDPDEMACGAGSLPSMLPTLADLVDGPSGATLTWDMDPTDAANGVDAVGCGNTDTKVFTGTVTCNLDNSVITTVVYTITDTCPENVCGGPICDISVQNATPIESCGGASVAISVHDIQGPPFNPLYDVDVYLYDAAGNQVAGPANLYTTSAVTLNATPAANMTCAMVQENYTVEVVCWQGTVGAPGTNLYSIPVTIDVYPTLTMTVVQPDCAGEAGSVTITAADGTVCDAIAGTAGGTYCTTNGDAVMDATMAAYDMTFFAGTSCEQVFSNAAVNTNCESCACPNDLGTYTPTPEITCTDNVPMNLPTIDALVDNPTAATLTWSPDPTVAVAQGCDLENVTYTGTVTCNIDNSVITTATHNFRAYPVLTVAEVAPDCAGTMPSVSITSPDGTVCFSSATSATAGMSGDCATAVDGLLDYTYTAFAGTGCEVTFANTLTSSCSTNACGGPICDITVQNATPIESCGGASVAISVHDIQGPPFNPVYDVDVYLFDAAGNQVAGPANLYTTSAVTLNATPAVNMTCAMVQESYTVEVVCWNAAIGAPGTNLYSIPVTIDVYPTLTMTVVEPDCSGEAGSVTITAPDGSVCNSITGTAGGTYCTTNGDAVMDATMAAYDMTFFAGTSCEQVFTNPAVNTNCESCVCPTDLGTYTPTPEVTCTDNVPMNLPGLDVLVDNPTAATLTWSPDPAVAVAQGCNLEDVTYTGTVTCNIDNSVITTTTHNFRAYPVLTVTEVAPDCAGATPSVSITAPDGTVCYNTVTAATAGNSTGDCATSVDGELSYTYTAFAGTACEVTFANTLTSSCGISACGGPVCDIAVVSDTPIFVASGATFSIDVHDVMGVGFNPIYDVDVYLYAADGTQVDGAANLYTTTAVTLSGTPTATPATGETVVENYTLEVVCWQAAVGAPGTNLVSIPVEINVVGPLPNDDCADAVNINGGGAGIPTGTPMAGSTVGATASTFTMTGTPTCGGTADDDVWFVFETDTDGSGLEDFTVTVTNVSGNTPEIIIYSGICGGTLDYVACGSGSVAYAGAGEGETYYVQCYDPAAGLVSGSADERAAGGFEIAVAGNALLPVDLTSFTGKAMDKYNALKWETASEQNTSEFAIERSLNGRDNWTVVGTEKAAGDSDATIGYSFDDMRPVSQAYYRLRIIDLDGSSQLSSVVSIKRGVAAFDIVLVAPNPTSTTTTVTFESLKDASVSAVVTDVTGKIISNLTQDAVRGLNNMTIDLSNAPSGIYFLTMNNGVNNITRRIVKK